jgi:hypothetical protein
MENKEMQWNSSKAPPIRFLPDWMEMDGCASPIDLSAD